MKRLPIRRHTTDLARRSPSVPQVPITESTPEERALLLRACEARVQIAESMATSAANRVEHEEKALAQDRAQQEVQDQIDIKNQRRQSDLGLAWQLLAMIALIVYIVAAVRDGHVLIVPLP